jgi:DNA-binding transcriptional LysR family regulator
MPVSGWVSMSSATWSLCGSPGHAHGDRRTPAYFERHPRPETPRDLTQHECIGIRLPTHGGLLPWEFDKDGRSITVRVEGQLIFNTMSLALRAVLDGLGLGYCLDDMAAEAIADGRLIRVLEDWCEPFPGYHIYYPRAEVTHRGKRPRGSRKK